jgi:hypothetical protein
VLRGDARAFRETVAIVFAVIGIFEKASVGLHRVVQWQTRGDWTTWLDRQQRPVVRKNLWLLQLLCGEVPLASPTASNTLLARTNAGLRPGTIKGYFDLANSARRAHTKAQARANEIFEVYVALHQSLWAVISLRSDAERTLKT